MEKELAFRWLKRVGRSLRGVRTPNPYFLFPKTGEFGGGEILLILKKIKLSILPLLYHQFVMYFLKLNKREV